MYFFREGFCWTNVLNPQARLLKVRLKYKTVNDVGSMSLFSILDSIPNYFLITLLNSEILFDYYREFINCTVNIQINDIRQIPIIIPTKKQLKNIETIFDKVYQIKIDEYSNQITQEDVKIQFMKIQQEIEQIIKNLYNLI
jgi:hypothetical protein